MFESLSFSVLLGTTIIIALIIRFLIFLFTSRGDAPQTEASQQAELFKKDWEKDVVYLYQFKRTPILPNLSPFCLKLETFLRANNIKHEVIESWSHRSKEGLVPFVELNGVQIADSQIIIHKLRTYFDIEEGLEPHQSGLSRALGRMIEGSMFYALNYSKIIENPKNFADKKVWGEAVPPFVTTSRFVEQVMKRLVDDGMGRHEPEDIRDILRRDIEAIDCVLGEKPFIFGDKPTMADYTLFGHVAVAYYLPYRQPITDLLDNDFPRVKALIDRLRQKYFPEYCTVEPSA